MDVKKKKNYDLQNLSEFTASGSIVIRKIDISFNGDDKEAIQKALENILTEELREEATLLARFIVSIWKWKHYIEYAYAYNFFY